MIIVSKIILYLVALWLIAVGLLMAFLPHLALRGLSKMASTVTINNIELGLRFIAGVAFVLHAEQTSYPQAFLIVGGFLAITAILILCIPRRWHAKYSVWWADKLPSWVVRILSPVSIIAGAYLAYLIST